MADERRQRERRRSRKAPSGPDGKGHEADADIAKMMFADFLTRRRDALGLTKKNLALSVGMAPSTVSRWEDGSDSLMPSLSKLRELTVVLKVTADTLLGLTAPTGVVSLSSEEAQLIGTLRSASASCRSYLLETARRVRRGG